MIALIIIGLLIIIFSFTILTVAGRHYVKNGDSYEQKRGAFMKKLRWMISVPVAVIMAVVLLVSGIRIIDSTEVGVVRTWGQINREIDAGFNLINPVSESVQKYDLRVHVRQASFASYTKDAQPLTAAVEYQYALDPVHVMDVVVPEKAKVVFAKYSAMTLLENRSTLSNEVAEEVKTLEELYHVNFTSVIVQDIDFSDAFEASVEAKMTAEQDALRAEQEKKTAVVKAEQEKEVAAIEAEAAIAQAQGEAEAMRITREALQNMPEAYIQQMWIEKWNGELPTVSGSDMGTIMNIDGLME